MKTELLFKDKKFFEDFPGVPREGDFVRHESLPKDLRVKRVVWTRDGISLSLEDPTGGHIWEGEMDGWACKRCGWLVMSAVPPGHPNFPGNSDKKTSWLDDCDEEIVRTVQQA